nr:hypothetical protein [Mesorhizobium tamadayense]
MEIDTDKIDDVVLGLLWLTLHEERRAWKGWIGMLWMACTVSDAPRHLSRNRLDG